jgi:type I restriction enzyme S subunit
MKSPVIKRKMTGIERGIRQGNISNSDITSLRIPMPPIYLQENFTHMVHRIDKLRFVIQKSLDETQTLFNSLMQQYFD